jgi:hypothetical protein
LETLGCVLRKKGFMKLSDNTDSGTSSKSRSMEEVTADLNDAGIKEPPTPGKKTPEELNQRPADFLEDGDDDEEEGYIGDHPNVGEGSGDRDWGIDNNGADKKSSIQQKNPND